MEAESTSGLAVTNAARVGHPTMLRGNSAVRLQDEHPPIAHIVGRDRRLLAHYLVEARCPVHLLRHRSRLVTDALPRTGEPFRRGKVGCYIEDGRSVDAHVIDSPDDIANSLVEEFHTTRWAW